MGWTSIPVKAPALVYSALLGADFRPSDVSPAWARLGQLTGQDLLHVAATASRRSIS